jgi:hypothetical protein
MGSVLLLFMPQPMSVVDSAVGSTGSTGTGALAAGAGSVWLSECKHANVVEPKAFTVTAIHCGCQILRGEQT